MQIMINYDLDGSGSLTMEEAEPLFRNNFEEQKKAGTIPNHINWSEQIFKNGFNLVDVDGNGEIDETELVDFAQNFLKNLVN